MRRLRRFTRSFFFLSISLLLFGARYKTSTKGIKVTAYYRQSHSKQGENIAFYKSLYFNRLLSLLLPVFAACLLSEKIDFVPYFPLPIHDMIWFEIHELGFSHQFKHNLSYHQSRHTFGTLMVSAGVPMESISKMMGHTNIRTTQGYAKVTDDKISEDMDKLIKKRYTIY